MNPDPEWEDVQGARRGDEAAWRRLLHRHYQRIYAQALLLTHSAASAEDIAQETFLRLVQSTPRHHEGSLGAYLSTIAYHLAIKETRRTHRTTDIDEQNPPDDVPSALDNVLKTEQECQIAAAIGALDEEHRTVLVLRCYGGHSYQELAEILHVPIGTVKSRIFYAVKSCQGFLREKGLLE